MSRANIVNVRLSIIIFYFPLIYKPFLLLLLGKNLFLNILRNGFILLKEHGVIAASLGSGTKVCGVAEHLGKRYISLHHLAAADVLHTLDTAAAGVDIADNVAHVFLRHGNFHFHNGLQKNRIALLHSVLKCHGSGNMECHL